MYVSYIIIYSIISAYMVYTYMSVYKPNSGHRI